MLPPLFPAAKRKLAAAVTVAIKILERKKPIHQTWAQAALQPYLAATAPHRWRKPSCAPGAGPAAPAALQRAINQPLANARTVRTAQPARPRDHHGRRRV
eukprot:COSAG06_NODE_46594_length_345_cov_2.597561_1_plen_99_part_10